jgi:hypothetical protein
MYNTNSNTKNCRPLVSPSVRVILQFFGPMLSDMVVQALACLHARTHTRRSFWSSHLITPHILLADITAARASTRHGRARALTPLPKVHPEAARLLLEISRLLHHSHPFGRRPVAVPIRAAVSPLAAPALAPSFSLLARNAQLATVAIASLGAPRRAAIVSKVSIRSGHTGRGDHLTGMVAATLLARLTITQDAGAFGARAQGHLVCRGTRRLAGPVAPS